MACRPITDEELCHEVAAAEATIAMLLADHLADDEELLPYVFMDRVAARLVEAHRRRAEPAERELFARVVATLESGLGRAPPITDQGVWNLVGCTVAETLEGLPTDQLGLLTELGPRLRSIVHR